jgi:hypothetical protein
MVMKIKHLLIAAIWVISMFHVVSTKAQAPGCPSVNAGADQNLDCTTTCANLTATVVATGQSATNYTVSSIPYTPPFAFNSGSPILVGEDDVWSSVINLPFPFCFFGTTYTQAQVGANGIITFNNVPVNVTLSCDWCLADNVGIAASADGGCTQHSFPTNYYTTADNSIMCPYEDIDPTEEGNIYYQLLGTAPCRMLVVSYYQIPYFGDPNSSCSSCYTSTPHYLTSQVVLYETTNIIDIYIQNKDYYTAWNSGLAVEGIQNAGSTIAYTVPGRNNTKWSATNDAWRFSPSGAPSYTVSWLQGGNPIAAGATTTVCPTSTTTYTAQVVYDLCVGGQLTLQDNMTVNVNTTAPTPTISGPSSICAGGNPETLDAGAGYSSYSWSNLATTQTIPVTTSGTYSVTVANGLGCTGTTSTIVNLSPNLTPAITGPSSICTGTTATLDAGNGYASYSWSNLATTQTIPVTAAGTYTVTVHDGSGCSGTKSAVVSINPNLTPSITGLSTICSGATATLNAGGPYASYLWSTGAATQSISVITAGSYTVTVHDGSGCSGTTTAIVNVNANPAPTITGPSSFCAGTTSTLDAGAGYSSYLWSSGSTIETASITTAGTYTVTVQNASGCSGTTSTVVSIKPSLTPAITGPSSICTGSTATLDAGAGYSTYSWSNLATTQTIAVTTVGTYTVTVSNASGCSGTNSMTVNFSIPVVNVSPPLTICPGNSTTLSAAGCTTYSWTPASTLSNPFIANPVATPTSTTTYTVTAYNGIGCSATDNVVVSLYPTAVPVISSSYVHTGFCDSTSVSDTLNAGSGYSQYSWSTGASTQTIFVNQQGTYTVTVIDSHGCTYTSTGMNIYVEPPITKPVILAATTPVFCKGDSVMLYVNNPYYTYQWSSGSAPVPTVWAFQSETFVVTVTDSLGCTSVSDPFLVQTKPLPVAGASYHNNMLNVLFYGQFSTNATSWFWNFGDGLSSTLENPTHTYATAGTYTVILTATDSCGSSNDTLVISVPGPSGIVEYGNDFKDLVVYPVPVSNDVFVEFTAANNANAELKLHDIMGKLIFEESLSGLNGKYVKSINMSGLASGLYFIELRSDKSFIIRKFNKQ